jgi:hypothetical protein
MRVSALLFTLLFCLCIAASADEKGDVDVRSTSDREILSGPERKLHSGEIVTVVVSGSFTEHDERHETHCKIDGLFCDDVTIPDPHQYGPLIAPVQVDFVEESTNNKVLTVTVGNDPVQVTIPTTVSFGSPVLLEAFILTGANRSISEGRYSLTATIIEGGRVAAFQAYLAAGARTDDMLRPVDVINDRLKECCASQVAIAIAAHADTRFSGDSGQREHLLRFALTVDPQNQTVLDHLATLLIQTGNFTGAMQVAKQAIDAATDDGDKSMGYLRLASATEEQWAGLNRGSLQAAISYYHQAATYADSSNLRAAQLQALIGGARALMKTRTKTALSGAVKLLDTARAKAPTELDGYYSGFSSDGNYVLTLKQKSGFAIAGLPDSPVFPTDYDNWTPLAISTKQDRILLQGDAGMGWWDKSNGFIPITTSIFTEVSVGEKGMVGRTNSDDISLLPTGGITKVIHKIAPPPAPGAPFHPSPYPDFVVAREASVLAWLADEEAINVLRFDGTSLRKVVIAGSEDVEQIALSSDGTRFAAVIRNGPNTSVRMWNVNDAGPAIELKEPNGSLLSPRVFNRPHSISFSPDGHHLVVTDDSSFRLVNAQTGVQESSSALQYASGDAVGHIWTDDTHAIVFTANSTKHLIYRYAAASGSIQAEQLDFPTFVFSSVSPFGIAPGPLFLKGAQEWMVRPIRRELLSVWSPSGSKLHSAQVDVYFGSLAPALVTSGGGYVVTVASQSSVRATNLQTNDGLTISTLNWPLLVSSTAQDEWQVVERDNIGEIVKIRQFKGLTEIGHYDVPAIDASIQNIFHETVPGAPAPPASTQPSPNWTLLSQALLGNPRQTFIVPNGWLSFFPCVHVNTVAMPVISLGDHLPAGPTGRTVSSCSNPIAMSALTKQVLYRSPAGAGATNKLIHTNGESTGPSTELFSSVTVPWPFFFGSFGQNSIVAGYVSTYTHTGEIKVWSNEPLGPILRPCTVCSQMNPSALNDYSMALLKQPWLPRDPVSTSGNSLVLPVGDRLVVQDIEHDTLKFRLSIRIPLAVTDSSLLTLSKDRKVRLWMF